MFGFTTLLGHFAVNCSSNTTFFGLVSWYKYLKLADDGTGHCAVQSFTVLGAHSSFLLIAMAIIDDLIRVAALVAFFFIIAGGFTYMTSQGAPDATGRAKSTIVNALVGLVIAILATVIVNYIGNSLGGA